MLASLFGTGIAALATRFNRRQNLDLDRMLQRLLDIIKAARCAAFADELDDLERQADEILAQSLAHDWNHALSGKPPRRHEPCIESGAASHRRAPAKLRRGGSSSFSPRIVGE